MFPVHPVDMPCVALAVDTAGTGRGRPVLRVDAVRFQSGRVLDRLSISLGSPDAGRDRVALYGFLGDAPLIVFGLPGTLTALEAVGVRPPNVVWDVEELASILLPHAGDGSLSALSRSLLEGGADPTEADAVRLLYLALVDRAKGLRPAVLHRLGSLMARGSVLGEWFAALAEGAEGPSGPPGGVSSRELAARLERPRPLGSSRAPRAVSSHELETLFAPDGPFAERFPRYQPRAQQIAMAKAVAETLLSPGSAGPRHLLVEGGTGIGKSVAYLVPAILFALRNNARVVVSTNTINLQEQLIHKDIPDVLSALDGVPGLDLTKFRYTQLKGKGNYLCLRRWEQMAAADSANPDEARTLAKTLVWLQSTATGDRAELSLLGREPMVWDRLSAGGFSTCPGAQEGACFYRYAREQTAAAHLVVVNHSLLLSDLLVGGALLPSYDYLIIDEAHNLEGEATRQFGFRVSQATVEEMMEGLSGILHGLGSALRAPGELVGRELLQSRMDEAQLPLYRVRDHWAQMVALLAQLAADQRSGSDDEGEVRVTKGLWSQPIWSDLEIVWDNFDQALGEAERRAHSLLSSLETLPEGALAGTGELAMELGEWLQHQGEARQRVAGFVAHPEESMVYWIGQGAGPLSLNGAPLEVAQQLEEALFAEKEGVVLTSATLTVQGKFEYVRRRFGLEEAEELVIDSPFNYREAALVCVPTDMAEPNAPGYMESVARAIQGLATRARGHTMALFTSHMALRRTAQALRQTLSVQGIRVLAQGVDGTPQQLLAHFQQDPRSLLLGAASFWEGVDIANSALKVLVVARLSFSVPTEPIFAARSELYDNPFSQYAIPQAVLRFRQGFGRLIRSSEDRGVVVVLDSRIRSKSYGRRFLASLPPAPVYERPLADVLERVEQWFAGTPARVGPS